jgi:23S rRNA (cytosine1962-C5)-methyltransferase
VAPAGVYEKSDSPARREEGLEPSEGWLEGKPSETVKIREDDLVFWVNVPRSQKTGFYLDQRDTRRAVRRHSSGRKVLNCFAYTGGFSVAALKGGAHRVDAVDASAPALELARRNVEENGFDPRLNGFAAADVLQYLQNWDGGHDFVILDPPAFARKKNEVEAAVRGYRHINGWALRKAPAGSLLLTCSCSAFVDAPLFRKIVFQAAREAGRPVRILKTHHQASDHPVNLFHPESEYLKSLLLHIG